MHGDHRAATAAATGYLPGLDGLRAISVLAVLLYHGGMRWLPGGFLGVEVFFVISGYLITLLLTREFGRSSTISLRGFWTRRARRLLAALYTLLAVVSATVLLFYREDADQLAGQVWSALAYVTNWFFIVTEQSYFALVERPPVFQHLWSLAIEEQFYLLWPLLLLGLLRLFRGRPAPIAAVIVAAAVASFVWMAVLFEPAMDPSRAYYGTDTRASGLLLGAALAMVWKPTRDWVGNHEVKAAALDLAGMGAVAVLVVCFAAMRETDTFLYRGGFAIVSVASCVAIMATVHPGTVLGRTILAQRALTWVGVRSYSLYLWHWPIFVFTRPEIDQPMSLYPTLAVRLVLTVVAAELSYRYVEVPIRNGAFRRWRQRLARREGARRRTGPIVLASAAGLLLVAVNTVSATGTSSEEQLTDQAVDAVPPPAPAVTDVATTPAAEAAKDAAGSAVSAVPTATGGEPTPSTGVAAVAAPTSSTDPGLATTLGEQARTITVLGDSVLMGAGDAISSELGAAGYIVDYRARPALMVHQSNDEIAEAGAPVGETVVIGLGHNSLWERDRANFENWSDKFDREADELLATLGGLGAKRVVWVTLREPSESVIPPSGREQYDAYVWYFPYVNERLDALVTRHPEVVLADWAAVSNQEGLTYDAMHLTSDGIRLMIDTIRHAGAI